MINLVCTREALSVGRYRIDSFALQILLMRYPLSPAAYFRCILPSVLVEATIADDDAVGLEVNGAFAIRQDECT